MDGTVTEIHITEALSSSAIMDLIDEYPNLAKITCPPSVFNRTSKKYIDVLRRLDIEVKQKYDWGAKSRTNGEELVVLDLAKKGFKAREISEKLNLKLNRVYYLLRKNKEDVKFADYNRKHDRNDIISLKEAGMSAKEISQKLNIPLRSVYYNLNKK